MSAERLREKARDLRRDAASLESENGDPDLRPLAALYASDADALEAGAAAVERLAEVEREVAELRARVPRRPFDVRCADALADEVAALIRRQVIDARSPAGDALLDYRNPPQTPRSDRIAEVERERDEGWRLRAEYQRDRDMARR